MRCIYCFNVGRCIQYLQLFRIRIRRRKKKRKIKTLSLRNSIWKWSDKYVFDSLTSFTFNIVIWLWLRSSSIICLHRDKMPPSKSVSALCEIFRRCNECVDSNNSVNKIIKRVSLHWFHTINFSWKAIAPNITWWQLFD